MRGVTVWVTNAAVWVTGKVGDLVEGTTSPDLTASWFEGQYGAMVAVAGALALLMLMLAVIQSVIRQDVGMLIRAAFGYLPMAFILAGVAIAATGLLIAITDDLSRVVVSGLGTKQSNNLLQAVGDAYKNALDESSGIPLFGVFLGAIILAIGAFVLWLEMIIRDAAIYVCVFFLPLTFVAMIWPATSRWARRLVELLVAIILAKFVIVSILSLATRGDRKHQRRERRRTDLRANDRGRGAARTRRLVAVRAHATDPDDGSRGSERGESALVHVRRCWIGRHPEPRRLHATGDGSQLTAVDLTRPSDNEQRNDLRPSTHDRAKHGASDEHELAGGRTKHRRRRRRADTARTDHGLRRRHDVPGHAPGRRAANGRGTQRFAESYGGAAHALLQRSLRRHPIRHPNHAPDRRPPRDGGNA